MDRRLMAPGPQQLIRPNSFIPTSSSTSISNNGKLGPAQIQQLALQSQLQAQHHGGHTQLHNPINNQTTNNRSYQQYNNQYTGPSNNGPTNTGPTHNGPTNSPTTVNNVSGPGPTSHVQFSHSTLPRHTMNDGQPNHQLPLPRTLQRKGYSTHYGVTFNPASNNPDPLYGNLMGPTGQGQHQAMGHHGLPIQPPNHPPNHSQLGLPQPQYPTHQYQQQGQHAPPSQPHQNQSQSHSQNHHSQPPAQNHHSQPPAQNHHSQPPAQNHHSQPPAQNHHFQAQAQNHPQHQQHQGTLLTLNQPHHQNHPPPPPQPQLHHQTTQPLRYPAQPPPPSSQPAQIQPVINQIQQQHHSAKILQHYPTAAENDGLPPSLVESMRTLFDILDDSKQGRVRLSDIESRWENNENTGSAKGNTGAEPLIKMGVMGYLRKVTPADGMLTFDRFCSGLRLALVTNSQSNKSSGTLHVNNEITFNNNIPTQASSSLSASQLHVKPATATATTTTAVSHNFYANNERGAISNNSQINSSSSINKLRPTSLPISTNHNVNQSQVSGGQRTSRIPGFNQSKVPINSHIPAPSTSPKNKFSGPTTFSTGNGNHVPTSAMATARRIMLNQSQQSAEQGTTVVMVHQPPGGGNHLASNHGSNQLGFNHGSNHQGPNQHGSNHQGPNQHGSNHLGSNHGSNSQGSSVLGNVLPSFSHRPHDIQIGTIKLTKPSLVTPPNGGFTKFKTVAQAQNGSLDNLKTEDEKVRKTVGKLRPPSAPLLDTTDDDDGGEYYNRNSTTKRERARSGDRALEDKHRGKQAEDLSFGKRVVSFVTPRQRTLSMPQLQLSKLKSKSLPVDDDSSPSLSSSSHSPLSSGETKKGGLKSSLKSTNHSSTTPSSIPTKMIKQKSETMTMTRNGRHEFSGSRNEAPPTHHGPPKVEGGSLENDPQAPPKPPRNNNLTVSVNNGTTTPEQQLSGSSTASTINHPSKPEIRQFLQSWKKGVAEKRFPDEDNTSGGVPPPIPTQPPPNAKAPQDTVQLPDTENLNNGTVKLRGDKKLNLRRRETARRHTVQAGIDFATLKRLKQLEQERDVLQQGIGVIENSKEWYRKQMEGVEDKISILTKGASIPDQWSDSLEDRLNLLSYRILEINGLLAILMDESTTRIPGHMNLQIPSHLSVRTITQLKEQNRQLTQEVSDCSHRVTQLETEKAMLLRQLFHQKSSHLAEETVYM